MSRELYQQRLKDLAAAAHGATEFAPGEAQVRLDNPLCGDEVQLSLELDGAQIRTVSQRVRGCLLCRAAASALAGNAPGRDRAELSRVRQALQDMLQGGKAPAWPPSGWNDLVVFEPVAAHKSRHRCVLLPFEAAEEALEES